MTRYALARASPAARMTPGSRGPKTRYALACACIGSG